MFLSLSLELDCARPDHADPPRSRWGDVDLVWPSPPTSSEGHPSLPSLVPPSGTSSGSSIWKWDPFSPDEFGRDVDRALDGVEEEVGGSLVGFGEVEAEEGFDIRSQVAHRSVGPLWLSSGSSSGGSSGNPIYIE